MRLPDILRKRVWLNHASQTRVCGRVWSDVRFVAQPLDSEDRQYHLPFAKPPKTISPISVTTSPIQKLQTMIRMIPAITMIPPVVIPPSFGFLMRFSLQCRIFGSDAFPPNAFNGHRPFPPLLRHSLPLAAH